MPETFNLRLRRFAGFGAATALLFAWPLFVWGRFCLAEDLFSYALLIPFVSAWLIWQQARELTLEFRPGTGPAILLAGLALLLLGGSLFGGGNPGDAAVRQLSLRVLAFVAALHAVALAVLGTSLVRQLIFPGAFLVFMAPLPPTWVGGIETGLQHASAEVSAWFFVLTGASFLRQGLVFQLPNIALEVAPECSGIRSTLVLFITSLVAGYLFLRQPWQRALFSALVIPLGIARNAFRIVTLGWLCTEYGPEMIHSPLHHRGGPVFFALSLLPLFGLLYLFRRLDRRQKSPPAPALARTVDGPAEMNAPGAAR
jgi:exosortase C (VPDSG-CTERM-specific)